MDFLITVSPLAAMWLAVALAAVITTPGRTVQRWRALRRRHTSPPHDHIDVSANAAATIVGGRLRIWLALGTVLLVVYLVSSGVDYVTGVLAILVAGYLLHRIEFWPSAIVYRALTGTASSSLRRNADRYYYAAEEDAFPRPLWRLLPAGTLMLLGTILIGAAVFPGLHLQHSGLSPRWSAPLAFTGGIVLVQAGALLTRTRRRREMPALTSPAAQRSARVPIVLIVRESGTRRIRLRKHADAWDPSLLPPIVPRRHVPLADAITWSCWSFGSVVSVIDPAQPQRRVVRELLDRASLVVLVTAARGGLRWEIDTIRERPDWAGKTLFVNPRPAQPDDFLDALNLDVPRLSGPGPEPGQVLIAAVTQNGRPRPVYTTLAEDADYHSAVAWLAHERQLPRSGAPPTSGPRSPVPNPNHS